MHVSSFFARKEMEKKHGSNTCSNACCVIRATVAPSPPKDLRSFAESPSEGVIPHVGH